MASNNWYSTYVLYFITGCIYAFIIKKRNSRFAEDVGAVKINIISIDYRDFFLSANVSNIN